MASMDFTVWTTADGRAGAESGYAPLLPAGAEIVMVTLDWNEAAAMLADLAEAGYYFPSPGIGWNTAGQRPHRASEAN